MSMIKLLRFLLLLSCILVALPALSAISLTSSDVTQHVFVEEHDNKVQPDIILGFSCADASVFTDNRQRARWVLNDLLAVLTEYFDLGSDDFRYQFVPWLRFSPPYATRSASWKDTNLLYQQLSIAG